MPLKKLKETRSYQYPIRLTIRERWLVPTMVGVSLVVKLFERGLELDQEEVRGKEGEGRVPTTRKQRIKDKNYTQSRNCTKSTETKRGSQVEGKGGERGVMVAHKEKRALKSKGRSFGEGLEGEEGGGSREKGGKSWTSGL